MAELVDALDSKSSSGNGVGVRFSPGAPQALNVLKPLISLAFHLVTGTEERYRMRMATPWRDPKTGTYYFRKAIPAKHQDAFKAAHNMRQLAKWSLRTKDPETAKARFSAAEQKYRRLLEEAIGAACVAPDHYNIALNNLRDRERDFDGPGGGAE